MLATLMLMPSFLQVEAGSEKAIKGAVRKIFTQSGDSRNRHLCSTIPVPPLPLSVQLPLVWTQQAKPVDGVSSFTS